MSWPRPERVQLRVDAGRCGTKGAAACPPVAWLASLWRGLPAGGWFSKRRTSRGLHGRWEKRPTLNRTSTRGVNLEMHPRGVLTVCLSGLCVQLRFPGLFRPHEPHGAERAGGLKR